MEDNKEFIVISSVIYNNGNFVCIINLKDDGVQYFGLATLTSDNELDINYLDVDDKENEETVTNLTKLFYEDASFSMKN